MSKVLVVGICLLVFFIPFTVKAQYTPTRTIQPEKSLLFTKQPDSIRIASLLLEKIFTLSTGEKVVVPFDENEVFQGTVIEAMQKNEHVYTVNIKAANYSGALMTLSRIRSTGQADRYIGRVVNIKFGDAFVLKREGSQYFFTKVKQSHLVTE